MDEKIMEEKAEQEYEVSHEECAGILGLSVAQYIADYINRERENSNTVWRTSCASQIWNGCSVLILELNSASPAPARRMFVYV